VRKQKLRGCLIVGALPVVLMLILLAGVLWRTSFAKTEILTSSPKSGDYSLTVYMIGEPDWPFGPTHCRFDLFRNDKRLVKYPFSIRDDGVPAHESNLKITWSTDHVMIIVSGSEQSDAVYVLNFDGTVAQQSSPRL